MSKKFKKGTQVVLKKPHTLTVEHIEIESAFRGSSMFHGHIKIMGFWDEVKRPDDIIGSMKNFGGVVYETPKAKQWILNLEKLLRKDIENEKKEDSKKEKVFKRNPGSKHRRNKQA